MCFIVDFFLIQEKDDGIIFGLSLYDVIGIAVGIALLVISSSKLHFEAL